jgi:hypothetical protein
MVASRGRYCCCSAYRDEARENLTPAAEAASSGCFFGTGKPVPFRCQPCTIFPTPTSFRITGNHCNMPNKISTNQSNIKLICTGLAENQTCPN